MNRMVLVLCLPFLLVGLASAQKVAKDGARISPFRAMRVAGEGLEVQITGDTWVGLESIAGITTEDLLRRTRAIERSWWKRITEDLPAVLAALGEPVGDTVDLVVRDLTTNERRDLPQVKMTAENRRLLWLANQQQPEPQLKASAERPTALTAGEAQEDLRALRVLLDEQFAYRSLRAIDLDALQRTAAAALGDGPVPIERLAREVDHILNAFGDGHSRLDAPPSSGDTFLPFLVQKVQGGHVAFLAGRQAFVDSEHAFVEAIDGVPLERWLGAARARGTAGSQVMQSRESERGLRELGVLRADLGVAASAKVLVRLRGKTGTRDVELDLARRRPIYGAWPHTKTRELDGGIGYLRLPAMQSDPEFLDGIDAAMKSFRNTKGLVIDVRGNGGGSRDALRRVAPYLIPADGAPFVGNVAAALRSPDQPGASTPLADRGLYPADWDGWNDAQRAAITAFARAFTPSWKLPQGRFGPWQFLVLDRRDNPVAFAYGKPVVVLIDRGCFSATDVFAAALGALPQVTLVGEATSGGSGRARGHRLPKSGIRLQLSTMASFRPDGVLFEGNGVVPDVVAESQPEDLLGTSDSVLARACELLR